MVLKLTLFFALSAVYVSVLSVVAVLKIFSSHLSQRVAITCTKYFCKLVLLLFNIKVRATWAPQKKASLYLSNHLSYLDAIALFSEVDAVFITSTEIRDSAGLGHLCKLAHCVFTNRESIWGIKKEIQQIRQTLESGFNVALFPEGTTSSGHFIKNFKSSLVQAAVEAHSEVIPITINYTGFNNRKPLLEDRDYYAWYGTMEFLPHIIRLATIRSLEISIKQLPAITTQDLSAQGARKFVTKQSQKMIDDSFEPVIITC